MLVGRMGVERSCELFRDFYNIIFDLLRGQVVRSLPLGKLGEESLAGVGGSMCILEFLAFYLQGEQRTLFWELEATLLASGDSVRLPERWTQLSKVCSESGAACSVSGLEIDPWSSEG